MGLSTGGFNSGEGILGMAGCDQYPCRNMVAREESRFVEVFSTWLEFLLIGELPIIRCKTVTRQHVASQIYQWAEFWRSMGSGWALLGDVHNCMMKRSWSHFRFCVTSASRGFFLFVCLFFFPLVTFALAYST